MLCIGSYALVAPRVPPTLNAALCLRDLLPEALSVSGQNTTVERYVRCCYDDVTVGFVWSTSESIAGLQVLGHKWRVSAWMGESPAPAAMVFCVNLKLRHTSCLSLLVQPCRRLCVLG